MWQRAWKCIARLYVFNHRGLAIDLGVLSAASYLDNDFSSEIVFGPFKPLGPQSKADIDAFALYLSAAPARLYGPRRLDPERRTHVRKHISVVTGNTFARHWLSISFDIWRRSTVACQSATTSRYSRRSNQWGTDELSSGISRRGWDDRIWIVSTRSETYLSRPDE